MKTKYLHLQWLQNILVSYIIKPRAIALEIRIVFFWQKFDRIATRSKPAVSYLEEVLVACVLLQVI